MSLRTRLVRVEKKVADREERKRLANCTCHASTSVSPLTIREFEADMNLPCPAHGVRQLGRICEMRFVKAIDGRADTTSPKGSASV
jgi:hypothetical protein